MPGLYLHIPFCRQACHYCNFHFSTSLKYVEEMTDALICELALQRDYLWGAPLSSIYFGGGTPSLLTGAQLERIFAAIYAIHRVESGAEITLEANPDDLDAEKLSALRQTPVNRLSIGVQSFSDADLRFMNRAHHAGQARNAIENALKAGFDNLTVDLIYGTPTTSDRQWAENIALLTGYGIPHISAYCLTVEERTALHHFVEKGKVQPVDEAQAVRQFDYLISALEAAGYVHYEISNFAQPGCFAQHNSSYWKNEPYLGIGPSAHSFNGFSRQWNPANNARYVKIMQDPDPAPWYEIELLTPAQQYNERILTTLRTIWGLPLETLQPPFRAYFLKKALPLMEQGLIFQEKDRYQLTRSGKFLADRIAVELFWEE